MRYIKTIGFITAAISLLFFAACGGATPPSPFIPPIPPNPPNPPVGMATFLIEDVVPEAALAGDIVTISYSGSKETPDIIWAGMTIPGTPISGTLGKITFQVPSGGTSGPLYLKKGDSASNSIWFSLSATSVIAPDLEDVAKDELGNLVAVNQVLISLKDGKNTYAEAERLAKLVDGEIVGQIPLMSAYQFLLKTKTLRELDEVIKILKADSSVEYVVKNIMTVGDVVNWSGDPDIKNQRLSNRVEQGANLYVDNVHQTDSSKTSPIFAAVGVVETAVDFTQNDFDGYAARLPRSNNIALYARNGSVSGNASHGSVVSGIVAAELSDSGMAGLLQAVSGAHGGFNVFVTNYGGNFTHGQFAATGHMVENNVQVINWSFGVHKEGALTSTGARVANNLRSEEDFISFMSAVNNLIRQIEKKHPKTVIVASAGNGDTDATDVNFRAPSSIVSNNLIIVGAHDNSTYPERDWSEDAAKTKHAYSNYGKRVDITAAGTVRDYLGNTTQGTSFSTPLVTATIATMLSIEPDLTPREIRNMLRKSALPIENTVNLSDGTFTVFTDPLTSVEVETDPDRLGKGARLNVEGAIQAALDKRNSRTVPEGGTLVVDLGGSDITKTVSITLPKEGSIYDKVDVLFLVDLTGSYGDDIAQFKRQATALVNAFKDGGKNVEIGLASFADFPMSSYGSAGDFAYRLNQGLTPNTDSVIAAINDLRIFSGNDFPESQLEALYQAATGWGKVVAGNPASNIVPSNVGWRDGALRIIFLATDASFHDSDIEPAYPGVGFRETLLELNLRQIRVYGLQSGNYIQDVQDIVDSTGGLNVLMSRDSNEIVSAVEDALGDASKNVEVTLRPNGDFAGLIQKINPESYKNAQPGDTLTFEVTFSRKLLGPDNATYVFSMQLEVIAEGVAVIQLIPVTVNVN